MKKIGLIELVIFGSLTYVQAQKIRVDLPHYGGKEFMYLFDKGDKKDTIAMGILDATGKTAMELPHDKKTYAGMSHLLIKGSGGVDFIVNKENLTVSCPDAVLNFDNIKYIGSPENEFLSNRLKTQNNCWEK